MSETLKILVMSGGPSAEREVSLRSGAAVAQALRALGQEVTELDPRTPEWELPPGTQVVFLALHGTYGEDGTVQGFLELAGLPYVGAGVMASAVGMDKVASKALFALHELPILPYRVFLRKTWETHPAQVVAELDALYALGARGGLFFVDDNFIGNRREVAKLLPRLAAWQDAHGRPFDLYTEASVDLYTAVLGGQARVGTLNGDVMLTIPAGTQNGQVFRLAGRGMPHLNDPQAHSDLFARIKVQLPRQLTPAQRELFEKLRNIS